MHYANGREAKNGDKIIHLLNSYGGPVVGVLTDAIPGNDFCNGSLSIPMIAFQQACVNLSECLHIDDLIVAIGAIKEVKDTSNTTLQSSQPNSQV